MRELVMSATIRRQSAACLQSEIQAVYGKIQVCDSSEKLAGLRLQLASLEHQISILRLLQAEDRLYQNLYKIGIGGLGLLVGLVLRPFLG
jgi:hypothetical protein